MPSTDRPGWELTPGVYSFRVRAIPNPTGGRRPGIQQANVIATLRTNSAVDVERVIDLNFVYLPDCGLTPAIVDSSVHFQQFLDQSEVWMEPTGIKIGRVTHVSLDRPEFTQISDWAEAGRMFRTSSQVGRQRALNIYCFEKGAGDLRLAAGLAAGIPGAVWNGTNDSGIALKMSPFMNCVPPNEKGYSCLDAYASLFAHEVGHFVGLYHTTEGNLENEDPFSDTPRCREPDLRICPDFDYVMFPLIHLANTIWSPGQVRVAQTHPLVRTVPVVGPGPRRNSEPVVLESSPNPFRESVDIRLATRASGVSLAATVYDVAGRRIRKLAKGRELVTWDGRDENGRQMPAGVYFVRARHANHAENLRIVKLR